MTTAMFFSGLCVIFASAIFALVLIYETVKLVVKSRSGRITTKSSIVIDGRPHLLYGHDIKFDWHYLGRVDLSYDEAEWFPTHLFCRQDDFSVRSFVMTGGYTKERIKYALEHHGFVSKSLMPWQAGALDLYSIIVHPSDWLKNYAAANENFVWDSKTKWWVTKDDQIADAFETVLVTDVEEEVVKDDA